MQDSPPRLQITDPSATVSYAPLSWLAVLSAALGVLFIVATVFLSYSAFSRKQPLMESWLLGLAAIAVVLAFVARRQIQAAEGTLVGVKYAEFGWWVGIVGFLGYSAYLTAIEFSFRREVDSAFQQNWAKPLQNINLEDIKDPELYASVFLTFPIGARGDLNRNDIASIDRRFQAVVSRFRNTDLIRMAGRNRGEISFSNETIRDWSMRGTNIECSLGVTATTPEGEFQLLIPMSAMPDEKKLRHWQIMIPEDGYIKSQKLTHYGWWIDYLQVSGKDFASRFINTLAVPGKHPLAYTGYIDPNFTLFEAERIHSEILNTSSGRAAIAGNLGTVTAFTNRSSLFPMPPDWESTLAEKIFAKPTGVKLTADELRTFQFSWLRPRSIIPGGAILKGMNDSESTLILTEERLELRVPIEIVLGEDPNRPSAAKGVIILELLPKERDEIRAELKKAKADGGSFLDSPPDALKTRFSNWRVTRIESDLRLLQPPTEQQQGPGGGGMGGFMG